MTVQARLTGGRRIGKAVGDVMRAAIGKMGVAGEFGEEFTPNKISP